MGEENSDLLDRCEQHYRAVAGALRSLTSMANCPDCRRGLESLAARYESFAALAESESRARLPHSDPRVGSGQCRGYWAL
jgi:hypothetical protein